MCLVRVSLHSSNMANLPQEVRHRIGVHRRPAIRDSILLKVLASFLLWAHSLRNNMDTLHQSNQMLARREVWVDHHRNPTPRLKDGINHLQISLDLVKHIQILPLLPPPHLMEMHHLHMDRLELRMHLRPSGFRHRALSLLRRLGMASLLLPADFLHLQAVSRAVRLPTRLRNLRPANLVLCPRLCTTRRRRRSSRQAQPVVRPQCTTPRPAVVSLPPRPPRHPWLNPRLRHHQQRVRRVHCHLRSQRQRQRQLLQQQRATALPAA